jgi:predicted enzyme related to lactoylglutathione lyase
MTTPHTSTPPLNVVNWFEVATDDPDTATSFYSTVFGWTFVPFGDPATADYRVAMQPGGEVPFGGVAGTGGAMPSHAIFYVQVPDVRAACELIERHGGKVVQQDLEPAAGPPFAYVHDPVGSLFGVYSAPA